MDMNTTPPSLLARLRDSSEPRAWDTFFELYTPLLFIWARRWGLQESDAADLVQDVLLLLLRKLPDFDYQRSGTFRGWLRVVLRNKWLERKRRVHPEPVGNLGDIPTEGDWTEAEEREYRQHLLRVMLKKLRPEFPETLWAAFDAYVLHGDTPTNVASRFSISPATVYSAKSKVFQRLRQELDGMM